MIDYEAKFWLPFKGVTKPVYAIPGNHDWYDALEAFLATFLEPDAARAAMRARAEADLRLTSTTDARIDGADRRSRRACAASTASRPASSAARSSRSRPIASRSSPSTPASSSGSTRAQWAWLDAALDARDGKFTMAILGHPLYAGGYDMAADNEDFARLKRLLLDHDVDDRDGRRHARPRVLRRAGAAGTGAGRALLRQRRRRRLPELRAPRSTGRRTPPTADWAFYPEPRRARRARSTRGRRGGSGRPGGGRSGIDAWPFSAEWLSALFDYNVAPFFQSFVEVRVEPSAHRIRLLPYGVHGRLRWRDISRSPILSATIGGPDDFAEWIVPMR